MKYTAAKNKLIIRYRPQDLDQHLNMSGTIRVVNSLNVAEYISETAIVESSGIDGINKGDEVIVQYLIAWDVDYDAEGKRIRNQYFIDIEPNKDNSELHDEIRWCWNQAVFGVRRNGKIIPLNGYCFCEKPEKPYEYKGLIVIPEIYRKQDTDNKGYRAKLKYINPKDTEELSLQEGQVIWAAKNTDATKKVWGEELIRVPVDKILAVE